MPADGGEAIRRTEGKRRIEAFEWSPEGKQIAFLAPQAKTEDEEKKEKDKEDARLVDRDDKRDHLWIMDTASWKPRELVGAAWQFHELQWDPRGDRLIVVATDHPESDQETNRIFSVNPSDGKMQPLVAPRGPFSDVRISPDGMWVHEWMGRFRTTCMCCLWTEERRATSLRRASIGPWRHTSGDRMASCWP